jgi:hypothetical protein
MTFCYVTAPATGMNACSSLLTYCQAIGNQCPTGNNVVGPPNQGKAVLPAQKTIAIPAPVGPTTTAATHVAVATTGAASGASNPVAAAMTVTTTVTAAQRRTAMPNIKRLQERRSDGDYKQFQA